MRCTGLIFNSMLLLLSAAVDTYGVHPFMARSQRSTGCWQNMVALGGGSTEIPFAEAPSVLRGGSDSISKTLYPSNIDETETQEKEDVEVLMEMDSRNDFERQVMSRLAPYKFTRTKKIFLKTHEAVAAANRTASTGFKSGWNTVFRLSQQKGLPQKKHTSHKLGDHFELDICGRFQSDCALSEILKACSEKDDLFPIGDHTHHQDLQILQGQVLAIEITEAPDQISQKVYQLERLLNLKPYTFRADTEFAGVIVMVNGDRETVVKVAEQLNNIWKKVQWGINGTMLKMFTERIPFYLCFTPYRNIYSSMRVISERMDSQFGEVNDKMDRQFGEVNDRIQGIENRMQGIENTMKQILDRLVNE